MFTRLDVCAAIITYNCDDVINKNIEELLPQVAHILIIDNGSNEKSRKILKKWTDNMNITVVLNNSNLGLALRLNQALEWSFNKGYQLFLTMDQDTVLHEDCVEKMVEVLNTDNRLSGVGPNRKDEESTLYTEVNYLITSGNLLVTTEAYKTGGYFSELFVDLIDIEFSLHMRKKGKKLAIANQAKMIHKVGEYETRKILGIKREYLSHSPRRFYYIYRNHVIVAKMYFLEEPVFVSKMLILLLKDTIKMFFEENSKIKLLAAWKGQKDGNKFIAEEREKWKNRKL